MATLAFCSGRAFRKWRIIMPDTDAVRTMLSSAVLITATGTPVSAWFSTTTLCARGSPWSMLPGKLAIHLMPARLMSPPTNAGIAMMRFTGSR